jgi:hypothetical protein
LKEGMRLNRPARRHRFLSSGRLRHFRMMSRSTAYFRFAIKAGVEALPYRKVTPKEIILTERIATV